MTTIGMATGELSTNNAGSSFILVPQEPSYSISGQEETKNNIEASNAEDEEEKKEDESSDIVIKGLNNDLTEMDSARLENAIEDSETKKMNIQRT